MIEISGKYNKAKVFADILDDETKKQIEEICNQDFLKDAIIRIMPDCHAGKGCVIGFTADLKDKVIPSIVGVDIGCGMLTVNLKNVDIDYKQLDDIINKYIPSGKEVHESKSSLFAEIENLYCYRELKDTKRILKSLGTLGGGNHFIEVDKDENNNLYLIIHTGSRNLGKQVAEYYQRMAVEMCSGKEEYYSEREKIIKEYKELGKRDEINKVLKEMYKKYNNNQLSISKDLCYLTGIWKDRYLSDMKICQKYAVLNREIIANTIINKLLEKNINEFEYFHTVHNYIDFSDNIVRKGSISANKNEKVLIPINMKEGAILAIGKGNIDYNNSAPHGAGRLMSRKDAKEKLKMDEFENDMKNIYTTSVCESTLDEAPSAYKPIESIINNIKETVDIIGIIKPTYNFKAKSED